MPPLRPVRRQDHRPEVRRRGQPQEDHRPVARQRPRVPLREHRQPEQRLREQRPPRHPHDHRLPVAEA